jgi:hypothetical protein
MMSMTSTQQQVPYLTPVDTAELLKQLIWHEYELSRMIFGWLPATGQFEVKGKLGRYGYLHMMNAMNWLHRIKELPGGLSDSAATPPIIREKLERIFLAPSELHFFVSYQYVLDQFFALYDRLLTKLDVIMDAPTVDQWMKNTMYRAEWISFVKCQVNTLYSQTSDFESIRSWKDYISAVWSAEARDWPQHPTDEPLGPVPIHSRYDPRFQEIIGEDWPNIYASPKYSPLSDSVRQMVFINATEIIAAESLCYLYYQVQGMPLQFYADLARHLWDEVRHSQMGVRRLLQMGYSLDQFRFFPHIVMNRETKLESLIDGYFSLTNVAEACSFKSKSRAAEYLWKHNDALSAIQSEFDIADERLHVDFGSKWGPMLYERLHQEPITVKDLAQRARVAHLRNRQMRDEEEAGLAENASQFCGTVGVKLNYGTY